MGCWFDSTYSTRMIPTQRNGCCFTFSQCTVWALANSFNVIGLQAGGQCFGGLDPSYTQLGPAHNCPSYPECDATSSCGGGVLGGGPSNQVFVISKNNPPRPPAPPPRPPRPPPPPPPLDLSPTIVPSGLNSLWSLNETSGSMAYDLVGGLSLNFINNPSRVAANYGAGAPFGGSYSYALSVPVGSIVIAWTGFPSSFSLPVAHSFTTWVQQIFSLNYAPPSALPAPSPPLPITSGHRHLLRVRADADFN